MHSLLPSSPRAGPPSFVSMELLTDVGNMLKAFIGLNFMYVAYAFSKAGLLRGCFGLIAITCLTEHCCILLVHVKNVMPGQAIPSAVSLQTYTPLETDDAHDSYETDQQTTVQQSSIHPPQYGHIAYFVSGSTAENLVNFALVLTQFGYCVGYLIFLSSTIHHMLPASLQATLAIRWFVLVPLPVLACVAMLTSIRSLGPFSIMANAALLIGFVSVVIFIAHHYNWRPSHPPLADFPLFFGQMTAALEGIGLVIPVETSMRNREKFPLVLRIALTTLTTVLMVVGVLGFVTFGENTSSIILRNFGKTPIVLVVKIVLVVGILFTYPLQIIPVFQFAEGLLIKDASPPAEMELERIGDEDSSPSLNDEAAPASESIFVRDRRRVAIRLTIIAATAAVAMLAGKRFGLFQSLVGSLGASCLAYTAPAFFHYVTFREDSSASVKAKDIGIVIFGIVGAVMGTATTIMAFHNGDGEAV